jgi:hypothetical protein
LDTIQRLPDGALLQKVELIGLQGVETDFYVDCERTGNVIRRINLLQSEKTWLSLNSFNCGNSFDFCSKHVEYFGEHNSFNKLNGRGIAFYFDEYMGYCRYVVIGNWNHGKRDPGDYILIWFDDNNEFFLGEKYIKDGKIRTRST